MGGFHTIAAVGLAMLLLAGASTAGAQSVPDPASKPLSYSFMFTAWAGVRQARFDALNRALARQGFAPLREFEPIGGFDVGFGLGRVHLVLDFGGGPWGTQPQSTGATLPASTFSGMFMLSYDVIQRRHLAMFMSTGIGGGALSLDARTPGLSLFPDLRDSDGDTVDYSYGFVPLEIGADHFTTLARDGTGDEWVLQLGARMAYLREIKGGWLTDAEKDPRTLHGPPVDASGLRARLVVGIGGHHGW